METIVEFDIPVPLPVPDDTYNVKLGKKTAVIVVSRVEDPQRLISKHLTGSPSEPRVFVPGAHSHLTIKFPAQLDLRSKILTWSPHPKTVVKDLAIEFVNRLIDVVRVVTKQVHLDRLRYDDVPVYDAYHWDGKQRGQFRYIRGETWGNVLNTFSPKPSNFPEERSKLIHELLANEAWLDLTETFILNAKDAFLVEDHRDATIEAVTALEIRVSEFIRRRGQKLGIPPDRIDNFIVAVGLTGSVDVVLRMLTEGLKPPDPKILAICKGAISVRNDILHRGLVDIPRSETEQRIEGIEAMCSYLNRLIPPT